MFVKRTNIVEAFLLGGSTRPSWVFDAAEAGKIVFHESEDATVEGKRAGPDDWIVKQGDKCTVCADAEFRKLYALIQYDAWM